MTSLDIGNSNAKRHARAASVEFSDDDEVFSRLESKVRSYSRAYPRLFETARGSEIWDVEGRRYLDFLAGAGSLNYGHNDPDLKAALLRYIESDSIAHGLDLKTTAKLAFLTALHDLVLAPRGLDYVVQFTGPTGANAVEAALKLARKATGRSNVIAFTNGFHGVTLGALSMTSAAHFRDVAGAPLSGSTRMPFDGYFGAEIDTVAYLERMLDDPSSGVDRPAAVILETIQGEGGLNGARTDWLQRLQALCRKRGILLIVDDIQAGCGRSGAFFSFERAGLQPDLVTLSKSLSGYGLPLSVLLIRRDLDIWKPAEHNGTFRGNNHAFVTATAALRKFWANDAFQDEVAAKGTHMQRRLKALAARFPEHLPEVKGRGMMLGLRCANPERAARVARNAFRHGLIIERAGPFDEVIKLMAPLTTSREHLDEGLDILECAIVEEFADVGAIRTDADAPQVDFAVAI